MKMKTLDLVHQYQDFENSWILTKKWSIWLYKFLVQSLHVGGHMGWGVAWLLQSNMCIVDAICLEELLNMHS